MYQHDDTAEAENAVATAGDDGDLFDDHDSSGLRA